MAYMRTLMQIVESAASTGMLAVKARLRGQLASDHDAMDGELDAIQQFGILDDLWITEDGGLMLYRALALPRPWMKSFRASGHRYWSTSPQGAAPYDGADKADTDTVVLIAELAADAPVEWDALWQTILSLHHVGEDEVRLEPGVRLTIRAVMVNGREVADCPLIGTNVIA